MNQDTPGRDETLTIREEEGADGVVVLSVAGEVDAHTCGQLEEAVRAVAPNQHVRLDISGVSFMDSSGLRVLITLQKERTSGGGSLSLHAPTRTVERLLEVTGLTETFAPQH